MRTPPVPPLPPLPPPPPSNLRAQVQTYRFQGHSPADPEHERGRKEEKRWARATQDPLTIFEAESLDAGTFTEVRQGMA